nr:flagellar basal body protein [Escherichia coli]
MDMINIGYSGASTAQVELNVTAQNTANAMTTGYTRQVAEISTLHPATQGRQLRTNSRAAAERDNREDGNHHQCEE